MQEPTATVKSILGPSCWRLAAAAAEQLLNLSKIASAHCSSPLCSGKSASLLAVLEKSTSRFELCLQHGAAEIRAFKSQTTARKRVSSLPDAAVITFESSTRL